MSQRDDSTSPPDRRKRNAAKSSSTRGRRRIPADRVDDDDDGALLVPDVVPILPLRTDVVFPQTVVPLVVNRPSGIRLIDEVLVGDKMVGLATQRRPEEDSPDAEGLYPTITIGNVLKMLKFPDGIHPDRLSGDVPCQGR